MPLPFWSKILLQILVAGFLAVSPFYPYLGIPAAFIVAIILVVNEIKEYKAKKVDFRNSVFKEIQSVLNSLSEPFVVGSSIQYSVWGEKAELLGKSDYLSIDRFYKKIDEANAIQNDTHHEIEASVDLMDQKPQRKIFGEARRIFDEISWLKLRRNEVESVFSLLASQYS